MLVAVPVTAEAQKPSVRSRSSATLAWLWDWKRWLSSSWARSPLVKRPERPAITVPRRATTTSISVRLKPRSSASRTSLPLHRLDERAGIRRPVLGRALLRVARILREPQHDRRRAGVLEHGAGCGALSVDGARRIAVHGTLDLPGAAPALEDPLGEDVDLAANVGDDQSRRRGGRSGGGQGCGRLLRRRFSGGKGDGRARQQAAKDDSDRPHVFVIGG